MEGSWYEGSKKIVTYVPGQFIAEVNVTSKLRLFTYDTCGLGKLRKLPQRVS
jgi:hypothetical protein